MDPTAGSYSVPGKQGAASCKERLNAHMQIQPVVPMVGPVKPTANVFLSPESLAGCSTC
jgi:hypothetical protein